MGTDLPSLIKVKSEEKLSFSSGRCIKSVMQQQMIYARNHFASCWA